ncbi:hydrogenase nickel incorporation protein HypA [Microbulbifer aggregans]|uniref:Hydrogenase nickel incorporation protein HypA n=1 Tax=Microbulbifer aggregans TaxID=1769779 RepID=A0A1C9W9V3_9GAMM|nr:hydrogenase maturation nickel metallochaperone HypA [Microbulbifer aggregans]AOS97938.1 hydrogenase nickel incorporation protein HypA [Microbulbifer aggregans]
MHEQSLINDLVAKIQELAAAENGRLTMAKLRLGALAHISPEHLREHFDHATAGTSLQGLRLEIRELPDINHPFAQDIILESLEFDNDNDSEG